MKKIELELARYNNHDFINVWEVDDRGVRYSKPLIALGKKKLIVIEQHLLEMKQLLGLVPSQRPSSADELPDEIPF